MYLMEGFDPKADHIQLAAMEKSDFDKMLMSRKSAPAVAHLEPKVPFSPVPWRAFQDSRTFDIICLARSAAYTPTESDALFDALLAWQLRADC